MRAICLLLFVFALTSCNRQDGGPAAAQAPPSPHLVIHLQPFNGMSPSQVNILSQQIKQVYPYVIIDPAIAIPAFCYYAPRNRYRADSIMHFLSVRSAENTVTIGLTNLDISTTKGNNHDWGVMGLGYQPGKACVVSVYRLSKDSLQQQLFKVAIHEFGHTQGLPHCSIKTCFMRDAEGHNPTNEETGFCPACKALLTTKGCSF